MFYVYEHIRPDTNTVFYVGKGSKKRAYSRSRNNRWKRIVTKNGGVFIVRILNWFKIEQDALDYEVYRIAQLTRAGLANLTDGGEGISGCVRYDMMGSNSRMKLPEYKERMIGDANPMRQPGVAKKAADKNRGRKRSEKFCENQSGPNNHMFGKPTSDKQKKAVSAAHKDRPKSYEQRSKVSTKVRGKNNGMSGRTGPLNPMFGKVSAMKGRTNLPAAFACYIRHVQYWGA